MTLPLFPSLPGVGVTVKKSMEWSTNIQTAVSGKETAVANWSYPRWHWNLPVNVLRNAGAFGELRALLALYAQVAGRCGVFGYADPNDSPVTGQLLGVGDGGTTVFQVVRSIGGTGGWVEPVWNPTVTAVYLNGAPLASGWSAQGWWSASPGKLTFTAPPGAGAILSADFAYTFICRFEADQLDFNGLAQSLWSVDSLNFYSVK